MIQGLGADDSFTIPYNSLTFAKDSSNNPIELGSGSFGTVYKGSYDYMDVAIKQLHVKVLSKEELNEFEKETDVMRKLNHTNILRLYGICKEIGKYSMVMEYMPKGNLYQLLHSNQSLSWSQRIKIAKDMGKGLYHLHSKNLLHRDLKSPNVLLDESLNAKLSDFGLSRTNASIINLSTSKQMVGTPSWMAPELFNNEKYTTKSDVYSYGVILWELASRKIPYENCNSMFSIVMYVGSGKREEIPKDTPNYLAKLISRCWDTNQENRPTIRDALDNLEIQEKEVTNLSINEEKKQSSEVKELDSQLQAFVGYQKAAEQGDANAQYNLGWCYANGSGVNKDEKEAAKWYRKAAEQGNAGAQSNLGVCYENGSGVNKDEKEAAKWYRKAAEQGNAIAQSNLGWCYEKGFGVGKDEKEAVKWYIKATEQGNSYGQCNLGLCYEKGSGVDKDEKEAVKWYLKAAEQGQANAQSNLGWCYEKGIGVGKDKKEAVKWYIKATEQGNSYGQCNLGLCYEKGSGVDKDEKEAVKWYRKAAEQGNGLAQSNLGVCYFNGIGVYKDMKEAVKWFQKAAEQGDAAAQSNLGVCYANGIGVYKDMKEAVKWFQKAAEQGDAAAQSNLGVCYANGSGINKDEKEAFKWYRKVAEQGHQGAQYNLGWCYEWGFGVDKDEKEAVKWYRKAADQGDKDAKKKLQELDSY